MSKYITCVDSSGITGMVAGCRYLVIREGERALTVENRHGRTSSYLKRRFDMDSMGPSQWVNDVLIVPAFRYDDPNIGTYLLDTRYDVNIPVTPVQLEVTPVA